MFVFLDSKLVHTLAISFELCLIHRQSVGNGRVASICTSAPFPPLGTYPPMSNVLSNIRANGLRHCPNIFVVRHEVTKNHSVHCFVPVH